MDRLHGLPSGEHRDGRIRADVLAGMWGSEVFGVMRAIEDALDPRGILNPGVTLSSSESWESWDVLAARETL